MVWEMVGWGVLFLIAFGAVVGLTLLVLFLKYSNDEEKRKSEIADKALEQHWKDRREMEVAAAPSAPELQYSFYKSGPWYDVSGSMPNGKVGAYIRYRYPGEEWSPVFTCINKELLDDKSKGSDSTIADDAISPPKVAGSDDMSPVLLGPKYKVS